MSSSLNSIDKIKFFYRVFGHFERAIFLELFKSLESKIVLADVYLFRIGDIDNSLYVVQKGLLHIFINNEVRSTKFSVFIQIIKKQNTNF
jgi:CRP-like cAMP-binding protein